MFPSTRECSISSEKHLVSALEEHISQKDEYRFIAIQVATRIVDAMPELLGLFLFGVLEVYLTSIPLVNLLNDVISHDADNDDDVFNRRLEDTVENIAENRFSRDANHRLWLRVRQWTESHILAGGSYHCLHCVANGAVGTKSSSKAPRRPHQFRNVFQRYRELEVMSVSFSDCCRRVHCVRRDGFRGFAESLYHVYVGSLLSVSTRVNVGTNVFEKDWDVLVVLDACRVDALRAVQNEYNFIDDVSAMWSVGSTTVEWMALTFRNEYRDEIGETAYVDGNIQFEKVFRDRRAPPHANAVPFGPSIDMYDMVDERDFGHLDTVYEYGYDDDLGVVPPRNITDRAIDVWRQEAPCRQIVHYLQPHEPYIGVEDPPKHALRQLGAGKISRERVWNCYLDTLRLVLDDVELLLENLDAETVAITADHGEAMGEWGFNSHNIGCPYPAVRKVPWVTTSGVDEETFEPSLEPDASVEPDTHTQLEDLGYL